MKRLMILALALVLLTAAHSVGSVAFAQEAPDPNADNPIVTEEQAGDQDVAWDAAEVPTGSTEEVTGDVSTGGTAEADMTPAATPMPTATANPTVAATTVATPVATQSPVAAPVATPAPVLKPNVRSSQPNVVQGRVLEDGTVWVMGELTNVDGKPAFNVVVTAKLVSSTGETAGTANQMFPYVGPGDTVGYRVAINYPGAYVRADVSVDTQLSGLASFSNLDVIWGKSEQRNMTQHNSSYCSYEFTGSVKNSGATSVAMNVVYVWFLDDQGRVVWADVTYVPSALASGDSYAIGAITPWSQSNPQITAVTQIRFYAAGQQQ